MVCSPTFTVFYHKIQANVVKYTSPMDPNYGIMEVETIIMFQEISPWTHPIFHYDDPPRKGVT